MFLFDPANGGTQLDAVYYGFQTPDFAVGRVAAVRSGYNPDIVMPFKGTWDGKQGTMTMTFATAPGTPDIVYNGSFKADLTAPPPVYPMGNSPARIAELISGDPPMNTGKIS